MAKPAVQIAFIIIMVFMATAASSQNRYEATVEIALDAPVSALDLICELSGRGYQPSWEVREIDGKSVDVISVSEEHRRGTVWIEYILDWPRKAEMTVVFEPSYASPLRQGFGGQVASEGKPSDHKGDLNFFFSQIRRAMKWIH